MADTKISALTAATTPLAGTEVLPIVQSSTTKKVAVSDLTAGRSVSAASLSLTTTPLAVTSGGTGLATVAQGDLLYGSASNTLSALAKNTTATRYLANTGTSNNPAWAQVDLSNGVTGTLPIANGGTAKTSFTAGQVLYGSFSQSSSLYFDGSNLGVGLSSPQGVIEANNSSAYAGSVLSVWSGAENTRYNLKLLNAYQFGTSGNIGWNFKVRFNNTDYDKVILLDQGNVGLSRWPSYTLDVNSTARFASTVAVGDATPSASGAGITFPATQSASTDANTLDDYEEGTWTPAQGSGLTVVGAFSSAGRYTKIGRIVTVEGYVAGATSVACSASGIITDNLPFSVNSTSLFATGTYFAGDNTYGGIGGYQAKIYNNSAATGAKTALYMTLTYSV